LNKIKAIVPRATLFAAHWYELLEGESTFDTDPLQWNIVIGAIHELPLSKISILIHLLTKE
jgi:hypothetical protein